jgi:hypothetical protein
MKDFYSDNPAIKPSSAASAFYPKHFGNLSKPFGVCPQPSGTCPQLSGNIPKPFGNETIPGGSIPGQTNERFENGFIFRRTYCCCVLPLIRIINKAVYRAEPMSVGNGFFSDEAVKEAGRGYIARRETGPAAETRSLRMRWAVSRCRT